MRTTLKMMTVAGILAVASLAVGFTTAYAGCGGGDGGGGGYFRGGGYGGGHTFGQGYGGYYGGGGGGCGGCGMMMGGMAMADMQVPATRRACRA
jgi:hypothetical protein